MRWPSWLRFGYPTSDETCVVYEVGQRCPYRWTETVEFPDRLNAPGELRLCAWHAEMVRQARGLEPRGDVTRPDGH